MKKFISLFILSLTCFMLSACNVTAQDLHDIIDIVMSEDESIPVNENEEDIDIVTENEENIDNITENEEDESVEQPEINNLGYADVHDFLKEAVSKCSEGNEFSAYYMYYPEDNLIWFSLDSLLVTWDEIDAEARRNPEEFMKDFEELETSILEIVTTVRDLGFDGEFNFSVNASDGMRIFLFISYAGSRVIDYSDIYVTHTISDRYSVYLVGNTCVWSSPYSEYLNIGTITFYDPITGIYGAFGHSVDGMDVYNSEVYETYVRGLDFEEGTTMNGATDEHQAITDISTDYGILIGDTFYNGEYGAYGNYTNSGGWITELYEVAWKDEVHEGTAYVFSEAPNMNDDYIYGYQIEITETGLDYFYFEVVDEFMLSNNVGIAAGMSGCPIIQDGYFIGALSGSIVTESNIEYIGFGVYAEDMLKEVGIIY